MTTFFRALKPTKPNPKTHTPTITVLDIFFIIRILTSYATKKPLTTSLLVILSSQITVKTKRLSQSSSLHQKKPLLSLTNGKAEMPLDIKLELFLQENDYGTHVSKDHLASIKKLMKQTKD